MALGRGAGQPDDGFSHLWHGAGRGDRCGRAHPARAPPGREAPRPGRLPARRQGPGADARADRFACPRDGGRARRPDTRPLDHHQPRRGPGAHRRLCRGPSRSSLDYRSRLEPGDLGARPLPDRHRARRRGQGSPGLAGAGRWPRRLGEQRRARRGGSHRHHQGAGRWPDRAAARRAPAGGCAGRCGTGAGRPRGAPAAPGRPRPCPRHRPGPVPAARPHRRRRHGDEPRGLAGVPPGRRSGHPAPADHGLCRRDRGDDPDRRPAPDPLAGSSSTSMARSARAGRCSRRPMPMPPARAACPCSARPSCAT